MVLSTASLLLVSVLSATNPTIAPPSELSDPNALYVPAKPLVPTAEVPILGSGFGYTYAELNYVYTDIDGVSDGLNGWEGRLSWNLLAGLYVEGSYTSSDGDVDYDTYSLGVGYHIGLGEKLDLFGLLSYVNDDYGSSGGSVDEGGYELDAGARFMLLEKLEVNGFLIWRDVIDDDFGVNVGARWYLMDKLSAGVSVEPIGDNLLFAIGARFQF